jgi:hypothetical protein
MLIFLSDFDEGLLCGETAAIFRLSFWARRLTEKMTKRIKSKLFFIGTV